LCITLFSMDENTYSHPEEACDGKKEVWKVVLGWMPNVWWRMNPKLQKNLWTVDYVVWVGRLRHFLDHIIWHNFQGDGHSFFNSDQNVSVEILF
jgi:hypothetical protein